MGILYFGGQWQEKIVFFNNDSNQFMKDTVDKILTRLNVVFGDEVVKMKGMADIDVIKGKTAFWSGERSAAGFCRKGPFLYYKTFYVYLLACTF